MKYLNIFLLFFLVGICVAIGYKVIHHTDLSVAKQNPPTGDFSIIQPPKQSVKGQIASMSGDVNWESRTATQPATLLKPRPVQQGELLETGKDGKVTVVFPNAGTIHINQSSHLEFIQTLPVNFVFSQNKGLVDYEKKGNVPFSVRTFHLVVSLENGTYSVNTDADNDIVTIAVHAGSAKIAFNNTQYVTQIVNINEGEQYAFDDTLRQGTIERL